MAATMTPYVHHSLSAYTYSESLEMSTLPSLTLPQNIMSNTVALVSPNPSPREISLVQVPVITLSSTPPLVVKDSAMLLATSSKSVNINHGNDESSITSPKQKRSTQSSGMRLNKFVRRLHDMLQTEQNSGIVEWRRGLLVLHSTDAFAKTILPKYFNTKNFKTFRRQLNYYGFVHVRSFSTTGSTTTALWVNRDLATNGTSKISTVLMLKRVEPCESAKTAEGRRVRKELAVSTVEDDIGVSTKSLHLDQMHALALQDMEMSHPLFQIPLVVHCDPQQDQPSGLLPRASPISWSGTYSHTVSDSSSLSDNDDDAANLLMMLSQSNVKTSALATKC